MSDLPKIIDNDRRSLHDVIDTLSSKYDTLSIATGYRDLPGTALVIDKLLNYKKIRLLIGREPLISRHQISKPEPDYPDLDIFRDLENTLINQNLKDTVVKIKQLISEWKLEVKVYRGSFLHAKCYIFGDYTSHNSVGIIWSSNFTRAWLTTNTELNDLEPESRIVTYRPLTEEQEVGHLFWFEKFWNSEECEDRSGKFIEILSHSPVGDAMFSPYEMYIKTLYELYKDELTSDVEISDHNKHTLMPHQIKNVQNLIRKLERNKVAMLADSVWLWKTATAIEVIRQYKYPSDSKRGRRVEVIVPSSLERQRIKEMWKFWLVEDSVPITPFHNEDRLNLRKDLDKYAPVNLFVIDESHNLRNTNSKRFDWVYKWIEQNPDAHVLLLTATPINNQINDLTNQILLAAKGNPNIAKVVYETASKQWIKIANFYEAFKDIQSSIKRSLTQWQDVLNNYDRLKRIVREIIWKFIVRNTREGVKKDPNFQWHFPHAIPQNANYEFSLDLTQSILDVATQKFENAEQLLWFDTNQFTSPERVKKTLHPLDEIDEFNQLENKDISKLSPVFFVYQLVLLLWFLPYRWRMYEEKYYNKTYDNIFWLKLTKEEQAQILSQLSIYGMLRVGYLKRLESSVFAIKESIERYGKLLSHLKESILQKNQIVSFKKLDLTLDYLNGDSLDDEAMKLINPYDIPAGFKKAELLRDIDRDISLVEVILQQLDILGADDSKIKALAETINYIQTNNINNGKVLLFSFFSDTVDYLRDNIGKYCPAITEQNTAFASGKNRSEVTNYAERFAPIAKEYTLEKWESELQFLFSTDVLSEWQNLQDCGIIINYDLHWNPVRMIQRNGRINRLWSKFEKIYIYNMFPEQQLDHYLGLVKRLENKIEMINFCVWLDQPVLSDDFEAVEFIDDIKKLYTNPDEDLMDELEAKTDILSTEDGFLQDLKEFDQNADEDVKDKVYNKIPFGKWWSQPAVELSKSIAKRPEVLFSSKLYTKTAYGKTKDSWYMMFATIDKKGERYERIEPLIALQLLKSQKEAIGIVNQATIDAHVMCEKISREAAEKLQQKYEYESNESDARTLKPTEIKFIEDLITAGYEDSIRLPIKGALTSLNNTIRLSELKKYYTLAKADIHHVEHVTNLAEYAKESLDIQERTAQQQEEVVDIKPMLYYVWPVH